MVDAARLCFSRIAFQSSPQDLEKIFSVFARAYLDANPYYRIPPQQLSKVCAAFILFSVTKSKSCHISFESFCDTLQSLQIDKKILNDAYLALVSKPIPLFFLFASSRFEPEPSKEGDLMKIGGMFKSKTKRYFLIEDSVLKYYKDSSKKVQLGEVELAGAYSHVVEASGKEPDKLVIERFDGEYIGSKITPKEKKRSHHKSYIAYGTSLGELKIWDSVLNFVSFRSILYEYLGHNNS